MTTSSTTLAATWEGRAASQEPLSRAKCGTIKRADERIECHHDAPRYNRQRLAQENDDEAGQMTANNYVMKYWWQVTTPQRQDECETNGVTMIPSGATKTPLASRGKLAQGLWQHKDAKKANVLCDRQSRNGLPGQ